MHFLQTLILHNIIFQELILHNFFLQALILHNHFPLGCLAGVCTSYPVDTSLGHLQHYRYLLTAQYNGYRYLPFTLIPPVDTVTAIKVLYLHYGTV